MNNKRHTGIELLRIVSMLMICILHYLSKGGILGNFYDEGPASLQLAWLLEAFCYVSVNVFVFITGYYSKDTDFKAGRLLSFFGMVEFYSLGIYVLSLFLGMKTFDINDFLFCLCPISTGHYWFATNYFVLLLLLPLLSKGLEKLSNKALFEILIAFIIVTSVVPTVIPIRLSLTDSGYGVLWFFTLYLTGAYLRRVGVSGIKKGTALLLYFVFGALTYLSAVGIRFICDRTGMLHEAMLQFYKYNSLTVYIASLGLFLFFLGLDMKENRLAGVIRYIAGSVFGVYLLHEHVVWRYEWPKWLDVPGFVMILLVFAAGICVESVRRCLFDGIGRLCRPKKKQ